MANKTPFDIIESNIVSGAYKNPFHPKHEKQQHKEYWSKLIGDFRRDLKAAYQMPDGDVEQLIWELSWRNGRSGGWFEALGEYDDFYRVYEATVIKLTKWMDEKRNASSSQLRDGG